MPRLPFPVLALALAMSTTAPLAAQQQSQSYTFLQAVREAKGDEVTRILDAPGTRIIDTKDPASGEGALHIVARRGDVTYMHFLLGRQADPNIRDGRGNSPLMIAAQAGQESVFKALIDAHANVNLANASGETPIIIAVQHRDSDMVRELLAAGANPDQRDVVAGLSARDYAKRDARALTVAKLLDAASAKKPARVSGPTL